MLSSASIECCNLYVTVPLHEKTLAACQAFHYDSDWERGNFPKMSSSRPCLAPTRGNSRFCHWKSIAQVDFSREPPGASLFVSPLIKRLSRLLLLFASVDPFRCFLARLPDFIPVSPGVSVISNMSHINTPCENSPKFHNISQTKRSAPVLRGQSGWAAILQGLSR